MAELKPCPFCGCQDMVINEIHGEIKCPPCGLTMSFGSSQERFVHVVADVYRKYPAERGIDIAIRHWNRRAGDGEGTV